MTAMFNKWHPSVTPMRVVDAARRQMTTLDNPGFCLACGNSRKGARPTLAVTTAKPAASRRFSALMS